MSFLFHTKGMVIFKHVKCHVLVLDQIKTLTLFCFSFITHTEVITRHNVAPFSMLEFKKLECFIERKHDKTVYDRKWLNTRNSITKSNPPCCHAIIWLKDLTYILAFLVESSRSRFLVICLYLCYRRRSNYQKRVEVSINRFNHTTMSTCFKPWISIGLCCDLFFVSSVTICYN
jgi:hypothetical protein